MKQYVFEVIEEVAKQRNRDDKIKILKENETWALKDVIRGIMDSKVIWNLPEGEPPYNPSPAHHHPANLTKENRNFKYFVKGGPGDKMPAYKREKIFIGILEGVHPEDAKLVISMINKQKPNGLSRPVVEEAFPNLLKDWLYYLKKGREMVLQQLEKDLTIHASKLRKRGRINRLEKIVKKLNFVRRKIKLKQVLEDKFQIN